MNFSKPINGLRWPEKFSSKSISAPTDLLKILKGNYIYVGLFVGFSILLARPLWILDYLPLADLPQHAAQLRSILDYPHYESIYQINWFTPYIAAYTLTLLLAVILPLTIAIKIVLSLCLLSVPLATAWLIKSLCGHRHWVWIAFPAAWSFSFHWGFLSYVFATPVAIAMFAFVQRYSQRPLTIRRAAYTALFSLILFLAHALAWLFAMAMSVAIILMNKKKSGIVKYILPLLFVLPLVFVWTASTIESENATTAQLGTYSSQLFQTAEREISYIVREFNNRSSNGEHWRRLLELLAFSVGQAPLPDFALAAIFLLFWPRLSGACFRRDWRAYLPISTALTFYFLVPYWIFDTAYVYQRFAVFLIPSLFFCYDYDHQASDTSVKKIVNRLFLSLGIVCAALLLLNINTTYSKFQKSDRDFDSVLSKMHFDKRVLQLIFDQGGISQFTPPYMHFGGWYQASKLGEAQLNFATDPNAKNVPVRHKDLKKMVFPSAWNPSSFNWSLHNGPSYDYFLVRAAESKSHLFNESNGTVVLILKAGDWQLYGKKELLE